MNKISTFLLWCFLLCGFGAQAALRVVVLGSSTSEGYGASSTANSWVGKYTAYLKGLNSENEVINLAMHSYTSYHIMATGNNVSGRPAPDVDRNITKALSLAPDVIIINMPTNDAANGYTITETMDNFAAIIALATAENVPVYISTSQGRNFPTGPEKRQLLIDLTAQINATYGTHALDFWTTLANNDGTINTLYDSGDGIHLNDAGHDILYNRVKNTTAILTYARADETVENINIDFGTLVDNTATQWNALTDFTTNGRLNNLKTSDGNKSGIYIYVHDDFAGVNLNGAIQNGLGYPQKVSEDSFYGLAANPSGGITLGGLSTSKKYRFKFYAGRMLNGDNTSRETKYVVAGQLTTETVLEVTNNDSNLATVIDVVPNTNGFITITASAGANNATPDKYFYMGAIEMQTTQVIPVNNPGVSGTILADFGATDATTAGNWNNFTNPRDLTTKVNLIKTTGETTGYKLYIHDDFNAINTDGTKTNATYPENATKDSFYGNTVAFGGYTSPTAGITLENLSADKKYSFKFFSSRAGLATPADNRETKFEVKGAATQTVYLNASNNTSNYATVLNMLPDANGKIVIDLSPGPNNTNGSKFFYLGLVEINYETTTLPVKLLSFSGKRTLFGNQLEWRTTNEVNNKGFEIYRAESEKLNVKSTKSIESTAFVKIGEVSATMRTDGQLSVSTYNFTDKQPNLSDNYYQLKQIDNNGTSSLSDVIIIKGEPKPLLASFSGDNLSVFATAKKGEGKLVLLNMNGNKVFSKNVLLADGSNSYSFATPGLPTGVYVLTLTEKEETRTVKVLKF